MDKAEAVGENAWTKLLADDKTKAPVIVKMANNNKADSMEKTPLNVEQLNATTTTTTGSITPVTVPDAPPDGGVHVEQTYNRTATYGSGINSAGGESSGSGTLLSRKESFFGTCHRQLRRSIKAVSESPGPLTR
ncbi:hypothetical protein ACLKA6_016531 [Drosophila palustris]